METSSSAPIRLRVAYAKPESTLGELTRSICKERVALRSHRQVPVDTEFIFELVTQGLPHPVEMRGRVERVLAFGDEFLVTVRYEPPEDRTGLDEVLSALERTQATEVQRKHLRVPINLPAQSDLAYSPSFLIRDLSHGGMGVAVEAPGLPEVVTLGTLGLAELTLGGEKVSLFGEIAWVMSSVGTARPFAMPAFGIRFGKLRPKTIDVLERVLRLDALPPPPWRARLSFGPEALARLP